jgi:hypothetical protein
MSILKRLMRNVQRSGVCDCWLWDGYSANGKYGHIKINGTRVAAHVASWEEVNGPMPEGLNGCHTCDVTFCINPEHIFAGTHSDNMRDSFNKKRHSRQKIGPLDVPVIRAMKPAEAAAKFGLHVNHVNAIQRRTYWSHIP